ncbi:acyl-CoA dehydrogenase family protein, partial [Mycobacterium tuberculosis]|nr:acyl-CoA dehydrogenase family protein [Mycobacterium tuberculosis]
MTALPRPGLTSPTALERMRRVAAAVAARHAADVDAKSRFPAETFAALRAERLLGVMIPAELGGEGLGLAAVAELIA